MHPWFSWLRSVPPLHAPTDYRADVLSNSWLDPIYYSFEVLMSNECEYLTSSTAQVKW